LTDNVRLSIDDYYPALSSFDKAVCEACAVSNFTANRYVKHYKGQSSYVFTRLCSYSSALISALPKSRWAKRDYESWEFGNIAAHVRAVMEGYLLFSYLSETPQSEQEWYVKLNIMHLNDCTRRVRLHKNIRNEEGESSFQTHEGEIKQRLRDTEYFCKLPIKLQKALLSGKALMIPSRDELLTKLEIDTGWFNAFYDLLSNYTHILPMSYYRMESNGRGTGVFNQVDLGYIKTSLECCTEWLTSSTNRMVELFPDSKTVRRGKKSKFPTGPKENRRNCK
jgi:hypothetical protein